MPDAQTFIPKGYTAGRHPRISEPLAARLERLPPRAGPQRLVVAVAAGARPADLDAFFSQDGLWSPRPRAPGILEVDVLPGDIARFAERKDLFAWIDLASRLFGAALSEGARAAEVEIALAGAAEGSAPAAAAAERRVKAAGGAVTAGKEATLVARVPTARLFELLQEPAIEAVEVKGAS